MATDRRKEDKHRALRQQASLNPRPDAVTHPLFREGEFFDSYDLLQVKYEMLRAVRVDKRAISEAAKAFGFSRPSFYQAQTAFEQGGLAALIPQKTGPRSGHKLTPAVMEFLNRARVAEPTVRAERLASLIWSPKSGRHKVDNQPRGESDEISTETEVHRGVSRSSGRAGDSGPAWIAGGCAKSGDVG
jgi:hypothetical protein